MNPLEQYERFEYNNTPIYINPEQPDWFIPTAQADFILYLVKKGKSLSAVAARYHTHYGIDLCSAQYIIDRLLSRLSGPPPIPYKGRAHYRRLKHLKECWFHLTNQCNMACGHCMFSSNKGSQPALPFTDLIETIDEAFNLGCRIFYFTGGEPFVYERFTDVCDYALSKARTHLIVLTNGKALLDHQTWLQRQPRDRFHFQISIDGLETNHDALRGKGSFQELKRSLQFLQSLEFSTTLAMAVTRCNVQELGGIVDFASHHGIQNLHYLWLFRKGKAGEDLFVSPDTIYPVLVSAYESACKHGVSIDNVEILKSQVFSLPGTRFDLSNGAWESLAVGPDGTIYPSPALVGESDLAAGKIAQGLENIWKNSPVFERIRTASLVEDEETCRNPLKYFIGGGDIDHSSIASGKLVGGDPYVALYNRLVFCLLAQEAARHTMTALDGLVCRMGERLSVCDEESASIGFTHSNCVLSLPEKDGYALVKSFYAEAAQSANEDIVNPVCYPESDIAHIPKESKVRSYGCGSPVLDCELQPGEVLVDLGSGTGTECFVAAKAVGPAGLVYGIDMLDEMLAIARRSATIVAKNIGYSNVEFHKGYLEEIPIDSDSVDVVISNCVINLSPDKRQTFHEIMRILKPGGRLCISDIVSEQDIPLAIKYSQKLRGECIGGAMKESDLFALIEDLSFKNIYVQKRFPYREVEEHCFYSVTYTAYKPTNEDAAVPLLYRGPFAAVVTDDGHIIRRGTKTVLPLSNIAETDQPFFVFDESGAVANVEQQNTCCCAGPTLLPESVVIEPKTKRYPTGCVVCGEEVSYLDTDEECICVLCGKPSRANAMCSQGHYVCDQCHAQDALTVIQSMCLQTPEDDMIGLLHRIRRNPSVPMHGPEHHPLVPGIILSVYKQRGGAITDDTILTGIERARSVSGGACSFWGICGAATGVGIAFSLILGATPLRGKERQRIMSVTKEVTELIAQYEAPRCCQRECWTALKAASNLSKNYLDLYLPAQAPLVCSQSERNKECIKNLCPLWQGT